MDDTNRPKLILAVLFLAVLILGFFLYQKLIVTRQATPRVTQIRVTPSPIPPSSPSPSPATLGQTTAGGLALNQKGVVKSLPSTGAPEVILALFATSAAVSGFFLRKFPE